MSYCVNCGVELSDSEKCCPLCGVEVINPVKPWVHPETRPYPEHLETIKSRVDRFAAAILISLALIVPIAITLLIDLYANRTVTWSSYVMGAIGLFFFIAIFPMLQRKPNLHILFLIDCAALSGYLLLIQLYTESGGWFVRLALPLTLALYAALAGNTLLFQKKLKSFWTRTAAILFTAGLYTVFVEVVINLNTNYSGLPYWSLFAWIPCTLLGFCCLVLRTRKKVRDALHRKLFM